MAANTGIAVSAVVPTYNRAHLVDRAIESILRQTMPPSEIIVVDDGSTDGTAEVVRRYAGRVRYVWQENGGGARARNRGVRESTGDWIAFLDSDDLWTDTHLQKLAEAITETRARADFYFDDMIMPEGGGSTWWGEGGFHIDQQYVLVPDAAEWVLREYQPMMLQTTLCRRSAFVDAGGLWDELRNAHDTHFFLKVGLGRPACAVNAVGAVQTADAPGTLRLTSDVMDERRYRNKTLAFRDILRSRPGLLPAQRRCLRERVADAYWRLGRIALSRRRPGGFVGSVARSFLADPRTLFRLAVHALGSRQKPAPDTHAAGRA